MSRLAEFASRTPEEAFKTLGFHKLPSRGMLEPSLESFRFGDNYWDMGYGIKPPESPKIVEVGTLFFVSEGQGIPKEIQEACLEITSGNAQRLKSSISSWNRRIAQERVPTRHTLQHDQLMSRIAQIMMETKKAKVDPKQYALLVAGMIDYRGIAKPVTFIEPELAKSGRVMKQAARAGSGYDIQDQAFKRLGPTLEEEFNSLQTSGQIRRWARKNKKFLNLEEIKEFNGYADYIGLLFGFHDEIEQKPRKKARTT